MTSEIPLAVKITATDDASSVVSGMTKSIDDSKESILALGAAATAVFAAVTDEIVEATKAASDHQNTEAQLTAVLQSTKDASGATADGINQLADALEQTTGYSKDTILGIDNLLLGFTNISSQTLPAATQAILDFATRTGTDATSATQLLGRALQDPTVGMTALRREGLVLSDQQQQMVKDFQAAGDMANAQGVIIDALNTKYGGAAEQTNTLAFQQRLLQSQVEEVQVSIGTALLPTITSLLAAIEPVITAMIKWTEAHPELTRDILIGTAAIAATTIALVAMAGAMLFLDVVSLPLTLTILAVGAAIAALVILAVTVHDNWNMIADFFKTLWSDVQNIFHEAITNIIAFFQPLLNIVDQIVAGIEAVANGIGSAVGAVGGAVSGAVHAIIPHASGGSVNPYNTYLVGENGPELFTSATGGSIVPNNQIGGGGQSININISGAIFSTDAANTLGNLLMNQLRMKTRFGV